jgi:hypothetical protein
MSEVKNLTAAAPVAMSRPLLGWTLHDSIVIARSTILASFRIPEALFFQLIQPVIFVLLFAYVFGGAIPIPGGDPGGTADASLYRLLQAQLVWLRQCKRELLTDIRRFPCRNPRR